MYYRTKRKIDHNIKNTKDMEIQVELELRQALMRAIEETNRCMVINGLYQYTKHIERERAALWKTWLCREVRKYLGWGETNLFFERAVVSYETEGINIWINDIHFDFSGTQMVVRRLNYLSSITKEIDYESLKYSEPYVGLERWIPGRFSRQKPFLKTVEEFNFDSVKEILNKYNQ
jgi:predicted metal-dependent phosphoesterase TrpH